MSIGKGDILSVWQLSRLGMADGCQLRDGSSLASSSKASTSKSAPSISAGIPGPRKGTNRLPGGACVPTFLQPWKHKILLAGKYLNVIRECGIEVKKADGDDLNMSGEIVMNEPKSAANPGVDLG